MILVPNCWFSVWLGIFLVALTSCATARQVAILPKQTVLPASPTLFPTATPDISLSFTPKPIDGIKSWLVETAEDGIPVDAAKSALLEAGWISDKEDWREVDMWGNGKLAWVVWISDVADENCTPTWCYSSEVFILDPHNPSTLYQLSPPDMFSNATVQVQGIIDFTGDNQDDVLLSLTECGAHTCWDSYYIVSTDGSETFLDAVQSYDYKGEAIPFMSMSYSKVYSRKFTSDQYQDLIVCGGRQRGGTSQVLQREWCEVYTWNGEKVAFHSRFYDDNAISPFPEESNLRFFQLTDANTTFEKAEWQEATTLYETVLNDPTLTSIPPAYFRREVGDETETLQQFAAFRLVLIALLRNDLPLTERRIESFSSRFPKSDYTKPIEAFWSTYQNTTSMEQSCDAFYQMVPNHVNLIYPLDELMSQQIDLILEEDICPFRK